MGWAKYIDTHGSGMVYDRIDNLGTGHPNGTACVLVPIDFATAASALPDVEIIDEATFETFWNDRCHADDLEEEIDTEFLQGLLAQIQLEKELGITPSPQVTQKRKQHLDPANKSRGVRKNELKTWSDAKKKLKMEIHPSYRKAR